MISSNLPFWLNLFSIMPRGTALIMQLCFDSLLIVLQQSCHDCLEQNTAYVTWSLCASVLLLLNIVPIQGFINPVQLSIFRVDCLDFVFYNRKISAYASPVPVISCCWMPVLLTSFVFSLDFRILSFVWKRRHQWKQRCIFQYKLKWALYQKVTITHLRSLFYIFI